MKVLTTGQVAKICKVAPRTVSKWFDSGRLKGYRIPGSKDRRIPRQNLTKFMQEHGMPMDEGMEEPDATKILIFSQDEALITAVKQRLVPQGFEIEAAYTSFEVGMKFQASAPGCLVVDFGQGSAQARQIIEKFQGFKRAKEAVLVALVTDGQQQEIAELAGAKEIFLKPFDPDLLAVRLPTLLAYSRWDHDNPV